MALRGANAGRSWATGSLVPRRHRNYNSVGETTTTSLLALIVVARPRRQSELPGAAELYERLLAAQRGGCAIDGCKNRPKSRRFHMDHDHVTGRQRGLLCHWHNRILPRTAREAYALAAYLDRWERNAS